MYKCLCTSLHPSTSPTTRETAHGKRWQDVNPLGLVPERALQTILSIYLSAPNTSRHLRVLHPYAYRDMIET